MTQWVSSQGERAVLPLLPWGHLAMPVDIFGCDSVCVCVCVCVCVFGGREWVVSTLGSRWAEVRDAVRHPTTHSATKHFPTPNVGSVKIGKHW